MVVYSLYRKSSALGKLNFYPETVRNVSFAGASPVITLGLLVQNTSNQSFSVASLAGNVYANTYLVGNVTLITPSVIQPNSQALLLLSVRFSLLAIVNDIRQAITTKNFSQDIDLEAYANIDNLQIPVNIKYKVGK